MQNQELFLITILKFPVIVIKFIAKVFSIVTYLPNYLILYLIDAVLFHEGLHSTLALYILSWIPRVILLSLSVVLFTGEFYCIFEVMQLYQHGLVIQIVGMILTLAGLLILMRKGYLTLLQKYNLTKLKSVLQHIELGMYLVVDCIGILVWLINVVLIINVGRSWSYDYDRSKKYQFIIHVSNLIRESVITYLQFFYVKIFFRVFGWRFALELQTYKKEKEQKNVLNCLVLLTLIYLLTLLDLIVIALFGLPCVLHLQRKAYLAQMKSTHQKYKVTLKMFLFVALHMIQFMVEVICLTVCWKNGIKALKKWVGIKVKDQLFQREFVDLLIQALLRIPYLLSLLIISVSVYKLKRRNYLLLKLNQKKQAPIQQRNQYLWVTFSSFAELMIDLLHYPQMIIVTLIKPWNVRWLQCVIDFDYTMNHTHVRYYFFKSIVELVISPLAPLLCFVVVLYDIHKPLQLYRQAGVKVDKLYQITISKQSIAPNPIHYIIYSKSQLHFFLVKIIYTLKEDIPHLPYYLISIATFLNIYQPKLIPKTTTNLLMLLQRNYFYLSISKSALRQVYAPMFDRIKASGGLTSPKEEYRFWKYAYKCQRLQLVQKIIGFLLPKKSVQNIKKRLQPQTQFSQIANMYWNNNELTSKMMMRLFYLIIEIILTIFGIAILLPLTLWRIPTFLKIFSYHRSKKYFFPILKKIYVQMFNDIITLPLKMGAFILAPKMFADFTFKTAFRYGPAGLDTFDLYQKIKYKFLKVDIFQVGLISLLLHLKIIFIVLFWIRKKQLKLVLREFQLTFFKLYRDILFIGPTIQSMSLIITDLDESFLMQMLRINNSVSQIFKEAVMDLPYLALMVFIFCTMPWRINYLIQTVKDMREDSTQRKSFFKLVRNIFKDYACILMNIVLLLSILKTKKALFLIRRNYRLNFFIGFLQYSYFKQLTNQMVNLGIIYKNIIFMLIAIVFGWTRSHLLINQLKQHRQKQKQEQQSALVNKKIYDNTVSSGKQLKTLHKMGYYNYISVCSFLTLPEIIKLRQVDQFNYKMSQREQIWFMKWELVYSKQSNQVGQDFQLLCKRTFLAQVNNRIKVTYQSIIMRHFEYNVFQGNVDLVQFSRNKLPQKYFNAIFKNYQFSFIQGYGPQNQLPQEENEDEQFLRLTNQVRRPRIELDEEHTWLHLFYAREIEFFAQLLHRYFREDNKRRLKQFLVVIALLSSITLYFSFIWILRGFIFRIDALIGIKIILTFYFHSFIYCLIVRCSNLIQQWVSLIPFDIYYDIINFLKNYIVNPTVRFVTTCCKAIKKVIVKIYLFLERSAIKGMDLTQKYAKVAYNRIIKPLYIKIAEMIRKIRDSIVTLFKLIFKSIKAFLNLLKMLVTSLYEGIRAIFSNINKLYYFILKSLMTFLLKFGVIGNLIFTLVGLLIMTLPSIIWWVFYQERWYLVVSTLHTMVLIVVGYKHLNKIRKQKAE